MSGGEMKDAARDSVAPRPPGNDRLATIAGPAYPSSPRASPRQTLRIFAIRSPAADWVNESKEHEDEEASNKMPSPAPSNS
jgi:hypothetical protein